MFKIFITVAGLFVLASCASTSTYMGYPVKQVPFNLAGGTTVNLPITPAGPIPAETPHYKVEVAGIFKGPSKSNPGKTDMWWGFSVTNKNRASLESVLVERVYPDADVIPMISDNQPVVKNGVWSAGTQPLEINSENLPWLFSATPTTFVYRFTIKAKDIPAEILYQPSSYSGQVKALFRGQNAR